MLVVENEDESKFTIVEFVPRLIPFKDQETLQLLSEGTMLNELELVPKFGIVAVEPNGLTELIEH